MNRKGNLRRITKNGANPHLTAVAANAQGEIFELAGYAAAGRDGDRFQVLTPGDTVAMPADGELMWLPERKPVFFNLGSGRFETLDLNPYEPGGPVYAVAAFNCPGYVITHTAAYEEEPAAGCLPLFSYGAVGWHGDGFKSAAIRVDREPRQDLSAMPLDLVAAGVRRLRKTLPGNRLRRHLEHCALTHGCPAGKNFFLGRFEAPLPTSRHCNAACLGCISLQSGATIQSCQERIDFTPSPREIADVALTHIRRVPSAVVSFGQGCEGDPLMAADVVEEAIRMIRASTADGTINMNTNASLPRVVDRLLDAGLDSIRVSLNSAREACYKAYFRPRGYGFDDVKKSIDLAAGKGKFVALNYLNCPGFTDTPEEMAALSALLKNHRVHMIQWRNLNYDPLRYLNKMSTVCPRGKPLGMRSMIDHIRRLNPGIRHGYFNPPKESR